MELLRQKENPLLQMALVRLQRAAYLCWAPASTTFVVLAFE